MSGPSRSTGSNSTIAMAAGVVVNISISITIVVNIAITISVGMVVVVVGVIARVSRSSLLLLHGHDSVVRHHGLTSSLVHSIPKSS